jgi:CheY-like chemotaxis protein
MTGPAHILVAEDSDTAFVFLQRAFAAAGLPHKLHRVPDGELALAYLTGQAPFNDRKVWPFPHLVILDVTMPKATAFDVLMSLRSRPDLKMPVLVLSGSDRPEDRQMALSLGAAQFLVKTGDFQETMEFARQIDFLLQHST